MLLLAGAFVLFPLISRSIFIGVVASIIWGACGLGFNAPQQNRLVQLSPQLASAVLGLNASFLYLGISAGSIVGGWVFAGYGVLMLPWAALGLTVLTLIVFFISYSAESREAENQMAENLDPR